MTESPLVKSAVIGIFIMILISLGTAFFSLFRGRKDDDDNATVKALTVRVGLSVALIVVLFVLSKIGIIAPN